MNQDGDEPAGTGPTAGMPGPAAPHGFARLARDSVIYAFGSVTGKVIGLLLLPIVTRLLVPAEFGRLDVLSTLATALTSVAVLGLDVAATRLYPELEPAGRRRLFGTWTLIALGAGLPIAAVLGLASPTISQILFGTTGYALAVAMVGLYVIGNLLQVVGLTALRNQRRPFAYAGVSTAAFVVNGVLVALLLHWRPEVSSALLGMAVGVTVGGVAALLAARHLVFGRPGTTEARALFRLGLPLVPALATTWLGDFVNRIILLAEAGAAEVGFLSVAVRFGSVGLLVVMGFQLAWYPHAFGLGQEPAALQRIADDAKHIVVGVTLTVVPVGLLAPELLPFVSGAPYAPALPALGLSLMVSIGMALYTVATMPSALSQHMRDLGISGTAAAFVTIGANFPLARLAGSGGTAAAMVLGQLTGVAIAAWLARSRAQVPLAWSAMLIVGSAAAVVIGLATLIPGGAPILVRVGLAFAFLAVLAFEGSLGELIDFANRARGQLTAR